MKYFIEKVNSETLSIISGFSVILIPFSKSVDQNIVSRARFVLLTFVVGQYCEIEWL